MENELRRAFDDHVDVFVVEVGAAARSGGAVSTVVDLTSDAPTGSRAGPVDEAAIQATVAGERSPRVAAGHSID